MEQMPDEEIIRIIRYLDNKMTPEEGLAFEAEVAEKPALRDALEFEKSLLQWGQGIGKKTKDFFHATGSRDKQIADMIKSAEAAWEMENPDSIGLKDEMPDDNSTSSIDNGQYGTHFNKVKRMGVWKKLAIAASVAGLIYLSYTLYLRNTGNTTQVISNNKKTDSTTKANTADSSSIKMPIENIAKNEEDKTEHNLNQKNGDALFAAHFKPDALPASKPAALEESFDYYEAAQYNDALNAFNSVDPNSTTRGDSADKKKIEFYISYYKSLSYLANNNASKAIAELQKAMKGSPDKSSTVKAQWYLALAYLKTGRYKVAEQLLNQLAENNRAGEYRHKAIALKEEMIKK